MKMEEEENLGIGACDGYVGLKANENKLSEAINGFYQNISQIVSDKCKTNPGRTLVTLLIGTAAVAGAKKIIEYKTPKR